MVGHGENRGSRKRKTESDVTMALEELTMDLTEVKRGSLTLWMIIQAKLGLLSSLVTPQLFLMFTISSRSGILLKVDEQESKRES